MEEKNEKSKNTWGGSRRGAGRPSENPALRSISLRIPEDVAAILDRQPNRSAFIIAAIRAFDKARTKK